MYTLFHTIGYADRVVAVELNKALVTAAEENLRLNGINNVHVIACDSQDFAYKVLKNKYYTIRGGVAAQKRKKQGYKGGHTGEQSSELYPLDTWQCPSSSLISQPESPSGPVSNSMHTSNTLSTHAASNGYAPTSTPSAEPDVAPSSGLLPSADVAPSSDLLPSSTEADVAPEEERIFFDLILVDPPRCGLDAATRRLIGSYDYIVYISCNPPALYRDIEHVSDAIVLYYSMQHT